MVLKRKTFGYGCYVILYIYKYPQKLSKRFKKCFLILWHFVSTSLTCDTTSFREQDILPAMHYIVICRLTMGSKWTLGKWFLVPFPSEDEERRNSAPPFCLCHIKHQPRASCRCNNMHMILGQVMHLTIVWNCHFRDTARAMCHVFVSFCIPRL